MTEHGTLAPPVAPRETHEVVAHGDQRTDPYFWLRQKDDPRVLDYLRAENAYTDAVMAPTGALQQALYDEMLSRIQETDVSAPVRRPPFVYFSRTQEGKQYAIACRRRDVADAPEEVILDENVLAEGHDYFAVGVLSVSEDHNLLAYSEDFTGAESYTLRIKDLSSGDLLPDTLEGTYYSFAWVNDGRAFYYTVHDEAMRPHRVYLHRLGTPQADDVLVFEETDERFFLNVGKARSKRFVMITSASQTTSEAWFTGAATGSTEFNCVEPRLQDVEYYVEHQAERFLITTNDTGRNFRLVEAPVDRPGRESWQELIAHRDDVKLEDVEAFAEHVVRFERTGGLPRLVVSNVLTGDEHVIEQPEPVYGLFLGANPVYESRTLRFVYTSLSTPMSQFDYDMDGRERILVKRQPVLGDFDPDDYQTERVWAHAPDGVRVPVSLVYRKGTALDGSAPCWLYAYGSYGASMDPYFSSTRLTLLDRGFVFAMAHIRGGGELGKPWHDAGRLMEKRNTFTDFIACAEHLIAGGYTSVDRLVIEGGSAGGLLMGAVTNMRPDLFAVVVADVPFVDAVNTILDASLPLTVTEYEEWGNPTESEDVYRYMLSYSPYDNVEPKGYPHLLVIGGLNDPRVHYWEPAKWVAKLRGVKTDGNRLLLKTYLDTGHGGPSGRYDALRERAFVHAFALDVLGLTGTAP
jgi:oligopeptidase B